jgi:hypothetical protein
LRILQEEAKLQKSSNAAFSKLGKDKPTGSKTPASANLEKINEEEEGVSTESTKKRKEICSIEELKRNVQDLLEDFKEALNDEFGAENESETYKISKGDLIMTLGQSLLVHTVLA